MEDSSEIFSPAGYPILSQEDFARLSNNRDYGDGLKEFYSTGGGKRVVLNSEDQRLVLEGYADTLRAAGLEEGMTAINWGAPKEKDHMSQWVYDKATEIIGVETVNESSAEEFENYRDRWSEVEAILSLPRMLKSNGERIQEEHGDLEEVFPNVELTVSAGDVMTENVRSWIEENYGARAVNFYAATELGGVATETENSVYRPVNDNLYLEILEEGAEPEEATGKVDEDLITSLENLKQGEEVTGSLIASMPRREEQPLIRYRAGDVWTAEKRDGEVNMRFEGREDNVVLFSGANLYPGEIDRALDTDYSLVVSEEDGFVKLNFFTPTETETEDVIQSLGEQNKLFRDWRHAGSMPVEVRSYEETEELERMLEGFEIPERNGRPVLAVDGNKSNRIAFDESYSLNLE